MRRHKLMCAGIAVALLLAGCTSSSGKSKSTTPPTTAAPSAKGPAPGVTPNSIKVGLTYVDAAGLAQVGVNQRLGDWPGALKALIEDINAKGGINGRKLVPVLAPIVPITPTAGDAACVKLTEDDDVFIVTGFFLNDGVNCVVGTHKTAVVSGIPNSMTAERLAKAQAPWLTAAPGLSQTDSALAALKAKGALTGKIAVYAGIADDATAMNKDVIPALKKDGVTPVATAIMDAPANDTAAIQNKVNVIAQKFQSAGADTVVVVGAGGATWPRYMQTNPYKPKLLFLDSLATIGFTSDSSTTSTSLLKDSLSAGPYGPSQAIFEEPKMRACIATLKKAGIDTPSPESEAATGDAGNNRFQAAFNACPVVALMRAWLEKAGKTLNYGTLAAAIDGLEASIPGDPTPRTYSAKGLDGNPKAYLFAWDESKKALVAAP